MFTAATVRKTSPKYPWAFGCLWMSQVDLEVSYLVQRQIKERLRGHEKLSDKELSLSIIECGRKP
eukprot:5978004-Amphidinium_carterae.1